SAILPCTPVHSTGRRTELSPCRSDASAASMSRASGALSTGASEPTATWTASAAARAFSSRARRRAATAEPVSLSVFMSVRPFLAGPQVPLDGAYLVLDVAAQLADRPLEPRLVELSGLH